MKDKQSFILYADLIHTVKKMPVEKAGKLFMTILEYVNDQNPEPKDMVVDLVFEPIKQQLKRDLIKWNKYIEKQAANGAKGGRPPKPKEPSETQTTQALKKEPKKADNVNVNVSVSDNVTANEINIPFSFFWNDYDMKINKGKCEPFWNKLSDDDRQSIMNYLPAYKLTTPNGEFRKNPLTFLRNKAWLDDLRLTEEIKTQLKTAQDDREIDDLIEKYR